MLKKATSVTKKNRLLPNYPKRRQMNFTYRTNASPLMRERRINIYKNALFINKLQICFSDSLDFFFNFTLNLFKISSEFSVNSRDWN